VVGDADALEAVPDRITRRDTEARRRLIGVLQKRVRGRRQVSRRDSGNLVILRRVVFVLAIEDLEAQVQRLVAEVRLVKAEENVALHLAQVGLQAQRFAQTQEVVGLIIQADKRAAQAAHAAIQADRVLALLVNLEQQVD